MPKLGAISRVKVKACANAACPDKGISRVRVERHHTGCEKMFVRHLLEAHPNAEWVQALALRYNEFHPDDVVPLCVMCHAEVHQRYLPHIKNMTFGIGLPIAKMSEARVMRNIANLRKLCAGFLQGGFLVRKSIVDEYYQGGNIKHSGKW